MGSFSTISAQEWPIWLPRGPSIASKYQITDDLSPPNPNFRILFFLVDITFRVESHGHAACVSFINLVRCREHAGLPIDRPFLCCRLLEFSTSPRRLAHFFLSCFSLYATEVVFLWSALFGNRLVSVCAVRNCSCFGLHGN